MIPTFTNGGIVLLVVIIAFVAVFAYLGKTAKYECPLVDSEGFRCGHRFTLRSTLEEHLTLCHELTEVEARRWVPPASSS